MPINRIAAKIKETEGITPLTRPQKILKRISGPYLIDALDVLPILGALPPIIFLIAITHFSASAAASAAIDSSYSNIFFDTLIKNILFLSKFLGQSELTTLASTLLIITSSAVGAVIASKFADIMKQEVRLMMKRKENLNDDIYEKLQDDLENLLSHKKAKALVRRIISDSSLNQTMFYMDYLGKVLDKIIEVHGQDFYDQTIIRLVIEEAERRGDATLAIEALNKSNKPFALPPKLRTLLVSEVEKLAEQLRGNSDIYRCPIAFNVIGDPIALQNAAGRLYYFERDSLATFFNATIEQAQEQGVNPLFTNPLTGEAAGNPQECSDEYYRGLEFFSTIASKPLTIARQLVADCQEELVGNLFQEMKKLSAPLDIEEKVIDAERNIRILTEKAGDIDGGGEEVSAVRGASAMSLRQRPLSHSK